MFLWMQIKEYYFARKRDGDWITTKLIREMVPGVSVHSFILKRERGFAIFGSHQLQISSSAPFNTTVNTSASAPRPLHSRHTTHKDYQQRERDSWWFSNRVYSSFLSLVKRWQIHLISAVWCYMNFTRETLSFPAQMSLKPEPSHSVFCLIEALRGKLNNSPV